MTSISQSNSGAGRGTLFLGLAIAFFGMNRGMFGSAGNRSQSTRLLGLPAPHQMRSLDEHTSFAVPKNRLFVVTGIITTENWTGTSPVVVRFDGDEVFKRPMEAGEVIELPPGLCAHAGTTIEIAATNVPALALYRRRGYRISGPASSRAF